MNPPFCILATAIFATACHGLPRQQETTPLQEIPPVSPELDVEFAKNQKPKRYQVINGTPHLARNIMLLDTVKGETSILCQASDNSIRWCPMPSAPGKDKIINFEVHRFAVSNGTPELARNIMLVDTKGANTWLLCSGENNTSSWCAIQ